MVNYFFRRSAPFLKSILAVAFLSVSCSQTPNGVPSDRASTTAEDANITSLEVGPTSNRQSKLTRLKMAIIPWQVSTDQQEKLKPLADYLSKNLGIPVDFQITKDYDTSVDLLVEGKVELAYLGPLTYVKAHQRDPQVEPLVTPIDKVTGRPWYTSAIVVRKDSGIQKVQDLKGKRFAFVSKSSTSGYLVAMAYFQEIGINPDRDFAKVQYAGSHDKVKLALISGEVDAIADDKRSILAQQKAGKLNPELYPIVWESQPIPNPPIVASSKVSASLKTALKKAFVNAPEGLIEPSGSESTGYTLVQDEDFTSIRKLQEQLQ